MIAKSLLGPLLVMNIYAFLAVINAIVSFTVGFFVYTQNRKSQTNTTFGLLALSVVAWSGGYFFWQTSQSADQALFWTRALMAGAIFIPIFNLHFVLSFLGKVKRYKGLLWAGYLIFFVFFLASFSPSFITGVTEKFEFPFWPVPGLLFHPLLIIWFLYIAAAGILLVRARKEAHTPQLSQIEYILFATIIGYGGGATNFFLWYDIPISPIGIWAPALYVGIVAYAMVMKQLFGIRLLLAQLLVGFISLLLFINVVTSSTAFEYLWKGTLLVAFLISGYLLIRSVVAEIKVREDLQKAYIKLKELDEAKSEFVSIASHQLRTPLTAVKGYISMLLEGTYGKLASKQKQPVTNIYDSNERLIRLVNDLLNISRIESGKIKMEWKKEKLQDVVRGVVEELEIKAKEKKLQLAIKQPQLQLPAFRMDPEKVRNIVLNIVDNAIKYTNKGSITLSMLPQPRDRRLATESVLLQIHDTGEGMGGEELSHLFESFSRGKAGTKMWTEGAGLGLYIAKQFVQMHKGKIRAESKGKGKGSTFFVELPVT